MEWYDDRVMPRRRTRQRVSSETAREYEIELIPGLERFVEDELAAKLGRRGYRFVGYPKDGRMTVRYSGPVRPLSDLESAVAVQVVEYFDVPRPKALLGHQHLTRLMTVLRTIIELHPQGTFETFRVSAAGADSSTFRRLRSEIASSLHLDDVSAEGHLQMSVRRPLSGAGWEVAVRLTAMPLSARAWRVCNRPDALNGTVAHAMVMLAQPRNTERFLNLACGSGTLLVERLLYGPVARTVGVEVDPAVLACAEQNLLAAGAPGGAELIQADVQAVPLPSASFDTIVTDLPYGMVKGTDVGLHSMYAGALTEAARLTVPGGALVVITARRRLFESTLELFDDRWERTAEVPLSVSFHRGYIKPSIYLLRRL